MVHIGMMVMTDQTVEALAQALEAAGAEVEIILLREYPIEFCLNCRACTQTARCGAGGVYAP